MALTKIGKEGITGISNASDATFLTATSAEGVTLAGTLAVTGVHTVGSNAVITSEGGAVTSNLVQGLAKEWVNFNGAGTIATRDSLNVASLTDNGTGDYTVTYSSAFSSNNYSSNCNIGSGSTTREKVCFHHADTYSASSINVLCGYTYVSPGAEDHSFVLSQQFGELA